MSSNDGTRWIPRTNDHILVLLQTDQPPAAPTHGKGSQEATKDRSEDSGSPAATERRADRASGNDDQSKSQHDMAGPGFLSKLATEDGEQPENFHGKEHQAEHVGR